MPRALAGQGVESTDKAKNSNASVLMNGSNFTGLITNNKDRVALVCSCSGTNPIWLSLGGTSAVNAGIMVPADKSITITGYTGAVSFRGTNPDRFAWSEI